MPGPPLTSLSLSLFLSLRPCLDAPRPPACPAGPPPNAHRASQAWRRGRPSLLPLRPLTSWDRASVAPPVWRPNVRLQRPPPPLPPPPLSPPPRLPPPPKLCPARRRGWEAGESWDRSGVGWEVGAAGRSARGAAVATLAPGGWLRAVRPGGGRGARAVAGGSAPRGGIGDAERRCRPRGGDGRGGAAPLYSASRSSRVCARLSVGLPGTDAAAGARLGDGLGGRSCVASASPRSIFKVASGLGRPPALPSLAPARPPRLPAAARRQPPGLRWRGGASDRAAPAGGSARRALPGLEGASGSRPCSLAAPGFCGAQR